MSSFTLLFQIMCPIMPCHTPGVTQLPRSHKIQIGDTASSVGVTKHLLSALHQFRQVLEPVTMWIDAICIDQNTFEEKNTQIMRMTEIYNTVASVRIWLGAGNKTSDSAMDFIPLILGLHDAKVNVLNYSNILKWKDLHKLLTRSWFSRRWVIQEIAFAKDASVHCGAGSVSWRDFADTVTIYADTSRDLGNQFWGLGTVEEISHLGAYGLIFASNDIFRRDSSRTRIFYRLVSFETLLQRLVRFEATEPRDVVYAILALAKDTYTSRRVVVDYSKPVWEVYREAVALIVQGSNSLDIILRPWAPHKDLDLPS